MITISVRRALSSTRVCVAKATEYHKIFKPGVFIFMVFEPERNIFFQATSENLTTDR